MRAAQRISRFAQDPYRVTGLLLAGSFAILLIALLILLASGAFSAFTAGLQGSLAEMAPYADTFRLLNLFWSVGWVLQLMGYALLTYQLLRVSDEFLAIPAFIAVLVAAIIGVLHGTFHMSVETWASLETARTGITPLAYDPLRIWIGSAFRMAYILALLGTAGFGWSFLRTKLLPRWTGLVSVGWGIFWIAVYLIGAGLPAILFIIPAVIGVVLLSDSSKKSV